MNHVLSLESMERYESHAAASYGYLKMKFSLNCFILYTQGVFPSQNSSFRCVGYITHMLIYLFGGGGRYYTHVYVIFVEGGVTIHTFACFSGGY